MTRLLIIAETSLPLALLRKQFEAEGYDVVTASSGNEGQLLANSAPPDAIVMDLNLTDLDGVQVVKKIRRSPVAVPIVVLSDRHAVDERAKALAEGADDYVTKPVIFSELNLRIETLLRRKRLPPMTTLSFDELEINLLTRTVKVNGNLVHMPSRPFALLSYFVRHQEEVISREKLAREVWSDESVAAKNVIEVYINQTRTRFAQLGHPLHLQTIRGKGYRLASRYS